MRRETGTSAVQEVERNFTPLSSSDREVGQSVVNAMTVDVEDYFQVSAFEAYVDKSSWNDISCRVEANVDRILELFETRGTRATFFTLGWVAERYPEMVTRIVSAGHELASHGWEHIRVTQQDRSAFREDVIRTRSLLEDISGLPVKGYRAASYSINAQNLWALDELERAGYKYSSSIAPLKHDLYGMPDAPRFAFKTDCGLLEIPITTVNVMGKNINCAGGGWFRLFPYAFSQWAINRVNQSENESAVFYFHPWEIDESQPRIEDAGWKSKFRHYLNLDKTYGRLERLLDDFQWGRMDDIFLGDQG